MQWHEINQNNLIVRKKKRCHAKNKKKNTREEKEKRKKKWMRRWRHNKAPINLQRDEYINTMKVNFRIGDEMPINKHVAIFRLHAWLTISFKVGFSWCLWIYLVDIFLVVLKVLSSDFWCVYEVFFLFSFPFIFSPLFFFCHIILFLAIRLLWFLSCH